MNKFAPRGENRPSRRRESFDRDGFFTARGRHSAPDTVHTLTSLSIDVLPRDIAGKSPHGVWGAMATPRGKEAVSLD